MKYFLILFTIFLISCDKPMSGVGSDQAYILITTSHCEEILHYLHRSTVYVDGYNCTIITKGKTDQLEKLNCKKTSQNGDYTYKYGCTVIGKRVSGS